MRWPVTRLSAATIRTIPQKVAATLASTAALTGGAITVGPATPAIAAPIASVTCTTPQGEGGPLVPAVAGIVAADQAQGMGECVSLTGDSYIVSFTVEMQYYAPGFGWFGITEPNGQVCRTTRLYAAIAGVAKAGPQGVVCGYGGPGSALSSWHRAVFTLAHSTSTEFCTAPWWMGSDVLEEPSPMPPSSSCGLLE